LSRPADAVAANTYEGGTTISAGTLEASHASALGSGGVTVDFEADLFLGWKSDGTWVNAIAGNGPAGEFAVLYGLGSFTSLGVTPTAAYLGSWGRDPDANTVWAVVDHNSQFAVVAVPEPGGVKMVGGAIAAAVMAGRR